MAIFSTTEGRVLAGEEREKVLQRIFEMLWMTGDCNQVNRIVDGSGALEPVLLNKADRDKLNVLNFGYIVATHSYSDVERMINGQDTECDEIGITVCVIDADGSSVVSFDFRTSEVLLYEGTVESFLGVSENYLLAW